MQDSRQSNSQVMAKLKKLVSAQGEKLNTLANKVDAAERDGHEQTMSRRSDGDMDTIVSLQRHLDAMQAGLETILCLKKDEQNRAISTLKQSADSFLEKLISLDNIADDDAGDERHLQP